MIGASPAQLSPLDLADLLLLALARWYASAVWIEPQAEADHLLRAEREGVTVPLGELPAARADAVAARLALIAQLDLAVPGEQVARVIVGGDEGTPNVQLFVTFRASARGLWVEIRRIPTVEESAAVASGAAATGPYELLEEIGRGGMGVVYRGLHTVLDKPVAIKVLHRGIDDASAARLVTEARAACRARHPSIVDVTDFGRMPDGRPFLVMELVDGETLAARLRRGPLPTAEALGIALQLADALGAAHEVGVVHRDVKPANVYLSSDGRVKLGDFGVAKLRVPEEGEGPAEPIVGTVWYMSTEQIAGRGVGPASDVYSLGCVMFEMLTGRVPYDGENVPQILDGHLSRPLPPVVGPQGRVPEAVERVVHRAMSKAPAERYPSGRELALELEAVVKASERGGWRRWLPT